MNDRRDPKADSFQAPGWVRHRKLSDWVAEMARLAKPDRVVWCDGSDAEHDRLCAELVAGGTFVRLNEKLRPGSYLARSNPTDVARMEDRTFICSARKDDAGRVSQASAALMRGMGSAVAMASRPDFTHSNNAAAIGRQPASRRFSSISADFLRISIAFEKAL